MDVEQLMACTDPNQETSPVLKRKRVNTETITLEKVTLCNDINDGNGNDNVILESLDAITTAWKALQPRIEALREVAQEREASWDALLQRTLAAVGCSDEELLQQREALAIERYGEEAPLFCTLPPSIAWLLPASAQSEEELAFAEEVEMTANLLFAVRQRLLAHITDAKLRGDRDLLRSLGPIHTTWGKEVKTLRGLDAKVGRRCTVASRRINAYREKQTLRDVEPANLRDLEANFKGYLKVLDFYRHSDAQRYSFNRQLSGPQHFADIRRNVAVLEVWDDTLGDRIFNAFAVSGADAPGVQPEELQDSLFVALEVEDGCGETYSRDLDAEFKLCNALCRSLLLEEARKCCEDRAAQAKPAAASSTHALDLTRPSSSLRAVLFSKKPLCISCRAVVFEQLPSRLPGLSLEVRVDEAEESEYGT